jgi:hypothetical protein
MHGITMMKYPPRANEKEILKSAIQTGLVRDATPSSTTVGFGQAAWQATQQGDRCLGKARQRAWL